MKAKAQYALAPLVLAAACGGQAPPPSRPTSEPVEVTAPQAPPPAEPTPPAEPDVVPAPETPEEASLLALSRDEAAMARGRTIYEQSCAVCHGPAGRGAIGPSLVDESFLHGGRIADVDRVVMLGSIQNGMPAYAAILGEESASLATAYVIVLMRSARADGTTSPIRPTEPSPP